MSSKNAKKRRASADESITLSQMLFSQGWGTRRECDGLILSGLVALDGQVQEDPDELITPTRGMPFFVQGQRWEYHLPGLVLLHKPVGYECSMKPKHHPGVLSLLPAPLRQRGLQPVGRLDVETTGALLLTDDGGLLHRLTSPKRHVHKVYEMQTARPITPEQPRKLLDGVMLEGEVRPVRAITFEVTGERSAKMVIDEGRYHQVRRMLAAVGNHVEQLHRSAVGPWRLPADLAPGEWVWIDPAMASMPAPEAPDAQPRQGQPPVAAPPETEPT